jgi:xanthine/CO dehydrogenase XdhC/CoxF family maturation factor
MRILLEPAGEGSPAADTLRRVGSTTALGKPASLVAVHESAHRPLGTYAATAELPEPLLRATARVLADSASCAIEFEEDGRRTRAFVEFLAPVPHLLICGAGPDAQPVARAAAALGWRVTVVDHRPAYAGAERFPEARVVRADPSELRAVAALESTHAVVVMSHHLPSDLAYLRELAQAGVPGYVGLLGPAARRQRILKELGPCADQLSSRIRGPVGIDIGAVTPEGIALAIISQIHACLAGRAHRILS